MNIQRVLFGFLLLLAVSGCRIPQRTAGEVDFTILHLNDVYEIAPLEGGKAGGLARVASVRKELIRENPNTIAVLAGDFLSPSFIGTLKGEDGERIAGLHMVEALNAMGLDFVTFGNHEFDIQDPTLLEKRMGQSAFQYTVCNAFYSRNGQERPFVQRRNGVDQPVPTYIIREFVNGQGSKVRVALVGVILPFNQQDYVQYLPVEETLRKTLEELKNKADVVIALTHLNIDEDLELARRLPQIPLFVGGHDHTNMIYNVKNTVVAKADANAKTVYIHRLRYDPATGKTSVRSALKRIDDTLPEDEVTKSVVDRWQMKVGQIMNNMGYVPDRVITTVKTPLECKEVYVRSRPTNYGRLTAQAFEAVWPGADVYLLNGGSMRLDDDIQGAVTEYDILRTFPFGGPIVRMTLPGEMLKKVLDAGLIQNIGEGGYLQSIHVQQGNGQWLIRDQPLDTAKTYSIVLPEFVASGKEYNLGFLGSFSFERMDGFSTTGRTIRNDIRDIVIDYLEK